MVQKFYFPLTLNICKKHYWGFDWDDFIEADGRTAYKYRGDIENALDEYNAGEDMVQYFDGSETGKAKIASAEWRFEAVGACLYGRVDVATTEPLTAKETEAVKDWISGQNSDGLGEGFEQKRIDAHDDSVIFVSFWTPSDEYRVMTEEEFKAARAGKEENV